LSESPHVNSACSDLALNSRPNWIEVKKSSGHKNYESVTREVDSKAFSTYYLESKQVKVFILGPEIKAF
jgi:hypothetical protein